MIQAAVRSSTATDAPSTGQTDEISPRRSAEYRTINAGGTVRADIVDELLGGDAERLVAIAGRAHGLKLIAGMLSFAEELSADAQDLFRMVGREVDAIYALAIQPEDEWRRTVQ